MRMGVHMWCAVVLEHRGKQHWVLVHAAATLLAMGCRFVHVVEQFASLLAFFHIGLHSGPLFCLFVYMWIVLCSRYHPAPVAAVFG